MTEEIFETQELDEKAIDAARALARKEKTIRRTLLIGFIFPSLSLLSDVFNFSEFGAWQILTESIGDIGALVALFFSYRRFIRGEKQKSFDLIPIAIILGYATGEVFIGGAMLYDLVGGLMIFALAWFILEPENGKRWWQLAIFHAILVLILGSITALPKFYLHEPGTQIIISTIVALMLSWQLARRFQIRSIQTRLLLIMLGLALTPILVSSVTSTLIDLRRETSQVENLLELVGNSTSQKISELVENIEKDLNNLEQNPYVISNTEILTQFTPTENTRQQINDGMIVIFRQRMVNSQYYKHFSLLDISGEALISTDPATRGENFQSEEGFSSALINQVTVDPYVDGIGLSQAKLYTPLIGEDGDIIAVIMVDLNFNLFFPILTEETQFLGETGEVFLVNNKNQLINPLRHSADIEVGSLIEFPDFEADEQMVSGETLIQNYTNFTGTEVLGARKTVRGLNGLLILEQNQVEAFNDLRLTMIINVVIAVITLIISVTFAVLVTRNFAAPIENISETARRVLRGERENFPEVDRVDEIGTLTNTLNEMTSQLLATTVNLEQTVNERTEVLERRAGYLETTSQISRATTGIYELNALLNTVAQLISENFGFYHVGIFINDDNDEFSVLRASNSEGGWKMLARGHKLEVGAQGIVGYVTGTGEPRVQQQVVGENSVYFDNPDLPLTRSEMALPLKVGDEIFGALDVQSNEEQAFSDEDVSVLQTLADSVAVSIQNTRLIEQLQENLEAERRLFGEITKETWAAMLSRGQQGFTMRSDARGTQLVASPSTETGRMAMEEQMPIIGNLDEELHAYPAALPVTVRGGATIGVVETQKPEADGPWTQEEISILENVSSELGLALDNARLFEEAQRRAQRDRIAAELSTKIWASSDMENILQTAVQELGSALNVSKGQIKLSLPDVEPEEVTENIVDGANQS